MDMGADDVNDLIKRDVEAWAGRYIVWNPASDLPVRRLFKDRDAADRIAALLSEQQPGSPVYVCEVVGTFKR